MRLRQDKKANFGASLSVKQCRNFGINDIDVLKAALNDLGLRRFRLMSYWDVLEPGQGNYDFRPLDKQLDLIEKFGGEATLCLGVKQPRWPENHWPDWVWKLPKGERDTAILKYLKTIVNRYKTRPHITSWQLENEAMIKEWGEKIDVNRKRLRSEYRLVKSLDPNRPIIMTTSSSWGIPAFGPIPDIVGLSYYRTLFNKGQYHNSIYQPWVFKLRALIIKLLWQKPSFIHELQAEPWGPKNIWEMDAAEQAKSMSPGRLRENIEQAKRTNLYPIYLWGLEWWYWQKINDKPNCWDSVKELIQ